MKTLYMNENDFTQALEDVRTLIEEHYSTIDSLCRIYYENPSPEAVSKKISEEVSGIISSLSIGGDRVEDLEALVNRNYGNIMADLRADFPTLCQADCLLFLYKVVGFSSCVIALFLKEEKIAAVYNRKFRLKSRIKNSTVWRKAEYLAVLNVRGYI